MTAHHPDPPSSAGGRALDDIAPEWGVETVLAALGEADAASPPASTRSAVLERAARSPRRPSDAVDPRALYASRVAAMSTLLTDLTSEEWGAIAAPYAWTVHGLVGHLLVVERYTAGRFGLAAEPTSGDDGVGHLELGAADIEAELLRAPVATAVAWADVARRIVVHGASAAYSPDAPAPLHGWPFDCASALVARAFEIWTHMDDICRATGRQAVTPPPDEVRTMSSFAVGALPFLLAVERPGRALDATRIVLTGPGGGTFDIGPCESERVALLSTDVVDYCRLVARRIAPDQLHATREGDAALLDDLLVAAAAFAV